MRSTSSKQARLLALGSIWLVDQNVSSRFQFNIFNIAILNTFWPFFTGIVVHLLAAMFQFARIILLPREA
jgi:hypothetical protein